MTEDKCPFCGAERDKYYSEISGHNSYLCGSFERDGKILRSRPECYEAELAALKSLVREMGGYLKTYVYLIPDQYILSFLNRPEVKAIMEEKE